MLNKTSTILIALLVTLAACTSKSGKNQGQQAVYVDKAFTRLYMPDRGGITGADGTISIALSDGSSLFITGDCFAGEVVDGKRDMSTPMLNNSLIHISGDYEYLGSYYGGTKAEPKSLCTPLEAPYHTKPFWYWPGHGFQHGSTLHLFMTKFYQEGEGQWGFQFRGVDYVRINMADYSVISQREVYGKDTPIHWGHCVMESDGYYYVYGTLSGAGHDPAELCVSRAKYDQAAGELGAYEYFDGEGWSADATSAVGCEGLDMSVSEQFSVFRHGDTYVLVTQRRAQQAGDIYSYIADTPCGPWRNKQLLYTTTEQDRNRNLFTYNAMAHPQYINENDELLVCYNINSYDVTEIFRDVETYRPVFLRVPMQLIMAAQPAE